MVDWSQWVPDGDEPYSERWHVGRDESVVIWPPEKTGEPRPGAAWLLDHPVPQQRGFVHGRVNALELALTRDATELGWDMFAIDRYGRFANGFHRASAVVKTGGKLDVWVFLNVSDGALDIGDTGRPRDIREKLRRHEYDDPSVLASSAGFLYRWAKTGDPAHRNTPFLWDACAWVLSTYPRLEDHSAQGRELARPAAHNVNGRRPGGFLRSSGLGAMLSYVLTEANPVAAADFMTRWLHPEGLVDDPAIALHRALEMASAKTPIGAKGSAMDNNEKTGLVVVAFNAQQAGKRPEYLAYDKAKVGKRVPKVNWQPGWPIPGNAERERLGPFIEFEPVTETAVKS